MMVVGAVNDGPNCFTVIYPPCIYEAAYTVGALITGADTIAPFSSRGPVIIDQSNRIKPNITAPDTEIRSSYNTSDSAYVSLTRERNEGGKSSYGRTGNSSNMSYRNNIGSYNECSHSAGKK